VLRTVSRATLAAYVFSFVCVLITFSTAVSDQTTVNNSPIVELTCQEPNHFHGSAAGFFVNSGGNFVTARHVVDSFETTAETYGCSFVALASQNGWSLLSKPLQVKDCIKSPLRDVAVCEVEPNPFQLPGFTVSAPTWPTARQKPGVDLTAAGFPQSAMLTDPAVIHGSVVVYDEMKFTCKSSIGQSTWLNPPSLWLKSSGLSPSSTEGMSGGPVFVGGGETDRDVIAGMFVCFGGSYVIAIPIDAILQFLHEQHISTQE